jgi:enediyne biosynthesis protein E4
LQLSTAAAKIEPTLQSLVPRFLSLRRTMRLLVSLTVSLFLTLVSAVALLAYHYRATPTLPAEQLETPATPAQPKPDDAVRVRFRDVARQAGVGFVHTHSTTDMHYVPEIMGGGAAWLDFDQDGFIDLFLVQGATFPPPADETPTGPTSRLYRNRGDGTFEDVTEQVGLRVPGFGQGVAVGDYDNDGFPDLFVCCYGHGHLYHNEPGSHGGRRFREVTHEAGIRLDGWCSACAWGDLHGRGWLDLFVGRYVKMDLDHYPFCGDKTTDPPLRFSCGPREFQGNSSVLYRNNGDGTFADVSKEAGLEPDGKALGVLILDLDGDGKPDLFVGNDEVPNFHYRNLGGGKLQSCGVLSGLAANHQGKPMGSMGLEADPITGSDRPDLFITTFWHEGTALFRNNGNNLFTDVSQRTGMFSASWNKVGWGTCFVDADLDGRLDLFVANGHVYRNALDLHEKNQNGEPHTYQQLAQFFQGDGTGHFQEISAEAGPYFQELHVGRGVAMGDFDNDGRMDIAVNHCGGPAALLRNETETPNHWLRLELQGAQPGDPKGANRDAIGARVAVRVGDRILVRYLKGGGSYYSSADRRLLFGLGPARHVEEVIVRWPNAAASSQRYGPLEADHGYLLIEGQDRAIQKVTR